MSEVWTIVYLAVAAVVFILGLVVAWRFAVAEDGDVGDLASFAFIAFGAAVLWPGLPVVGLAHLALERAKRRRVGS